MTILELQKELQKIYEKSGNIEVLIQNGDDRYYYEGQRSFKNVEYKSLYYKEIVVLS